MWYRKPLNRGDDSAQIVLLYKDGEGVPQDYAEAMKWTPIAATQGNTNAQSGMSFFYNMAKASRRLIPSSRPILKSRRWLIASPDCQEALPAQIKDDSVSFASKGPAFQLNFGIQRPIHLRQARIEQANAPA
jgi:TPR repeat protein